ncbi:MAG: Bax inhibitor-1/YccA family protein [Candidatus Nitronauta litoralis]|uniref:Bax inhibitor-1/YccA family protein n=1 Tax=Candidatus Nitronauta litoralis TaxID=2705533 RepID=A0A7T0BY93_9BACT|nr:MAG: Bax inhibitor-1/YccA family protein [Candidatus Nitronauta litoralis]
MQNIPYRMSADAIASEQQRFMVRVYNWMAAGLALTGIMALYVASSETMMNLVYSNKAVPIILFVVQIGLVIYLSGWAQKMSASQATGVFLLYAGLTGVTLSFIFLVYTTASVAWTFFVTAGTFGSLSLYGYVTKKDLSGMGQFLFMGLIGLILSRVANMFIESASFDSALNIIGVLIFAGLTVYDTQKIKQMNILGNEGTEEDTKEAIVGALTLYLDFINLFLHLLRIMGDRR